MTDKDIHRGRERDKSRVEILLQFPVSEATKLLVGAIRHRSIIYHLCGTPKITPHMGWPVLEYLLFGVEFKAIVT